ncbi:MAG: OsmC family protein [Bacteroidota bacterium]
MKRQATSTWEGSIEEGKGTLSTQSDAMQKHPYSFKSRFKDESGTAGTNPEELIAAAHAGCFNMALSKGLGDAGYAPEKLETKAHISITQQGGGFEIGNSKLVLDAKVPKISKEEFMEIAEATKDNCPVSKVLNVEVRLEANLEN